MAKANACLAPAPKDLRMRETFRINGVHFKNRILRSSMGGQLCAPNGAVTSVWTNFEKRFAQTGVAGLVSATVSASGKRYAPLYYPNLSSDRFVETLAIAIGKVKDSPQSRDCAYILQIGDPGYHTQTSLFSQREDSKSASWVFDLLYGYRNHASAVSVGEIAGIVESYAAAARRAKEAGCDGVEITASKGYLIHQFLNPATNRRSDRYGGKKEKRVRFLREVTEAVRKAVGPNFLFGVRISAKDYNYLPVNVRLPPRWPLGDWLMGNGLEESLYFAAELEKIGVDYLHVSNGFGFINPMESPGDFPVPEVRQLLNSTRHLSFKAALRAVLLNVIPTFLARLLFGFGWGAQKSKLGRNGKVAAEFRNAVKIPLIANGGFQSRTLIEETLASGACDMVSMARPLLANPNLLQVFETADEPERRCTFCNRCSVLTAIVPVGCYEPKRFDTQEEMERDILRWTTDPDADVAAAAAASATAALDAARG